MQTINIGRIKTMVSKVGLGCGRLPTGVERRKSYKLLEAAIDLGINYFDVAPSYGLGLAEDVLGEVCNGYGDRVVIGTKTGIARPAAPGVMSIARAALRPIANSSPLLKRLMLKSVSVAQSRNRFQLTEIESSLRESARRLKRQRLDVVLMHEISNEEVRPELLNKLEELRDSGLLSEYGSGANGTIDDLVKLGTISQYRYDSSIQIGPRNGTHICHGVVRRGLDSWNRNVTSEYAQASRISRSLGYDLCDPDNAASFLLMAAVSENAHGIVLVSTLNPTRLTDMISRLDWTLLYERPRDIASIAGMMLQNPRELQYYEV